MRGFDLLPHSLKMRLSVYRVDVWGAWVNVVSVWGILVSVCSCTLGVSSVPLFCLRLSSLHPSALSSMEGVIWRVDKLCNLSMHDPF